MFAVCAAFQRMTKTVMSGLFEPLNFLRGPAMKNRFALAAMTNRQSHADGTVSADEQQWLVKRAEGQFGLVITAAAHVQLSGQGFTGQIGAFNDLHVDGLRTLASALRNQGAVSAVQLYHGGMRCPAEIVGTPVAPSDPPNGGGTVYGTGSTRQSDVAYRGMTPDEIDELRRAFVDAALRAERAGFDGVEVHGAHGYLLSAFLSPELNQRSDEYGGALENRARLMFEVVADIRRACGPQFQVGLRLSAERYGLKIEEVRDVAAEFLRQAQIDYLDMSLWDYAKEPEDQRFRGTSLLSHFSSLPRGGVRLGAAGKIMGGREAAELLEAGCDFALIGKAGILRHDFPVRVARDLDFRSASLPVPVSALAGEAVSPAFIEFMTQSLPGFLQPDAEAL